MQRAVLNRYRLTSVDADDLGWPRSSQAVQDAHVQYRIRFGNVVTYVKDAISDIDVEVRAWLPVRAKGFLQCRSRRCSAQPGVAIHMRCADAGSTDDGQRVVLLKH